MSPESPAFGGVFLCLGTKKGAAAPSGGVRSDQTLWELITSLIDPRSQTVQVLLYDQRFPAQR